MSLKQINVIFFTTANQAKLYTEKLQQVQTKREEMEAVKVAKAQSKLKRVDITEKPDLVSNIVKKYDMKRSEVLERIHKKEQELIMKIERTMNREKPELLSEITKKYDEKRTKVLERIERKKEETRLKHEEKMNRVPQDKSALLPDIARNYEKRRSEVINRINCMEEEKKMKLEKKMKRVEDVNKRHKDNIQIVREKSMMNGFDQSLEEFNDLDGDQGYNGGSGEDDQMVPDVKNQMTDTDNEGYQPDGQQSNNTVGLMSSYNTLITKTVLPPIGCN